jgi:hypothetical protein
MLDFAKKATQFLNFILEIWFGQSLDVDVSRDTATTTGLSDLFKNDPLKLKHY